MDEQEARRIFEYSKALKCNIPMPITFRDLINGEYFGKGVDIIHIDNAEYLVQLICKGLKVGTITVTSAD